MALPIESVLGDIKKRLAESTRLVLQAPPGAGKTTVVPLELLNESWVEGQKIIVLEPRRLAAVASARRMAQTLGESVGETVGYRVRLDTKVSSKTKIEVVTEGLFVRMIQGDPALEGVGAVLFDEFHERSLQADLALALTLDCQEGLRDDLRILLMSATLDGDRLAEKLDASVVSSEGRMYPVETFWEVPRDNEYPVDHTVRIVKKALNDQEGSVLVFLPGAGEISRSAELLTESLLPSDVIITPLFGTLSRQEQDRAILPTEPGKRKVVLATNIAETSLTIDGITVVVDSGIHREPHYDPGSGMTRLVTSPISKASAVQRAGRAGRTAPGVCYRLWSEQNHAGRLPFQKPEICSAELSSLTLELALWGVTDPSTLTWFDMPPIPAQKEARSLLNSLGAIDENNRITTLGTAMAELGVHPRLAKIILTGVEKNCITSACDIAALLSERDIFRYRRGEEECDLQLRLDALVRYRKREAVRIHGGTVDRNGLKRVVELSNSWRKRFREVNDSGDCSVGMLLAAGFPDRVGLRRSGQEGRYLLASGKGAHCEPSDPLSREEMIVVPECAAREKDAKIFLATSIERSEVEELFANELQEREELFWDKREQRVVAREVVRLGSLIFSEKRLTKLDPSQTAEAVIEGIREMGIDSLPWNRESESLRNRLNFLHRHFPEEWPDMSDDALLESQHEWLAPFLNGITKADQFSSIDLKSALLSQFPWEQQCELDRLAPERMEVPEGSRMKIDYSEEPPVLAVKLQMMFGATETPAVANGTVPLVIHLLSPAGRPLQITQDLVGFWDGSYELVKKEMKGRYPKHPWPDNPREAVATAKTKRHL